MAEDMNGFGGGHGNKRNVKAMANDWIELDTAARATSMKLKEEHGDS
jgi:hypothetical protein